jgi:hypothetical protein
MAVCIINLIKENTTMEMNRLTREADELIRKVVARYNSLYSPTGTISQVDLDLLLDDLKHMYDKFKLIGQLNLQQQQQEIRKVPVITSTPTPEAPPPSAPSATSAETTHPESQTQPEKPIENNLIQTEVDKEEQQPVPPHQEFIQPYKEERKIEETLSTTTDNPKTLVDKFKTEQKSLGEVISSTDEHSVGSKLGQVPVSDLKSVIGLAEKFAFVNELFGGDPLAYEKAIIQLNSATRLNEAEAYLGTLRLNHKWPADSEHAFKLTEIIRRKFAL